MKPNVIVLRAPGTNCEEETALALEKAGANPEILHIWRLVERPDRFKKAKLLVIPGGFSYGDDVAAGRLLGNELRLRLKDQVMPYIRSGRFVLGICNGFQVLTAMGLLPDSQSSHQQEAALILNDSGRYEDRWVRLAFNEKSPCPFKLDDPIWVPVAHGEGKFVVNHAEILARIVKNEQIVAQYIDEEEDLAGYPHNPNGSVQNIAALCNKKGNVIGLMPHPERHINRFQHPMWTRMSEKERKTDGDGLRLFQRLIDYIRRHV